MRWEPVINLIPDALMSRFGCAFWRSQFAAVWSSLRSGPPSSGVVRLIRFPQPSPRLRGLMRRLTHDRWPHQLAGLSAAIALIVLSAVGLRLSEPEKKSPLLGSSWD